MHRRLPVYILADTSSSMTGEKIEAVKSGIRQLHTDLLDDPQAVENAYISVITFDSNVQQVIPMTELTQFIPPNLVANGTTCFGAALKLLLECMDREIRKNTPQQKGDWKPLIFILTDGGPTDSWEEQAAELKERRPANIVALAVGEDAHPEVLKRVTETVLEMKSVTPGNLKAFFKWVTQSIKTTSKSVGAAQTDVAAPVNLPPPPPQITIVP